MKYRWHLMLMKLHYRMAHVWNFGYHRSKWEYHGRKCYELRGLDYDETIRQMGRRPS